LTGALDQRQLIEVNDGPIGETVDQPLRRAATMIRLRRAGLALATAGWMLGVLVLLGYAIRNDRIVELSPTLPPMYPNAAIGLACGGLAILATERRGRSRAVAAGAAGVTVTIGLIGAGLHLAGSGPTWYEILFPADFVDATTPVGGRPALETCIALIVLGLSLLATQARRYPIAAEALAISATSIGTSAIVGYLLGVDRRALGSSVAYVGMALHTAIGITVLGLAAILVRPYAGFLGQLVDGGITGAMTRRLTLAVAGAPLALMVLAALTERLLGRTDLAQSVFSVLQVAVLGALVLIPSAVAARTEHELQSTLTTARRMIEDVGDADRMVEAMTAEMIVERPQVTSWEIGMRYEPAFGHLAGDSVQGLHRGDGSTLLVVFDLAGHDAYSAVMAYGLRAHIAALWENGASLETVASSAGAKLTRRGTIATSTLFHFTNHTPTVELVNAGHPPPLHVRQGQPARLSRTGPLLGIKGGRYEVSTVTVERHDLLVVWTDGVEEAASPARRQLGESRITELILAAGEASPQTIANACVDLALQHSQGRLSDDALVVVARYHGQDYTVALPPPESAV
jgi:hypothetical protein